MGKVMNAGVEKEIDLYKCGSALDNCMRSTPLFGKQDEKTGVVEMYYADELGVHGYTVEDPRFELAEDDGQSQNTDHACALLRLQAGEEDYSVVFFVKDGYGVIDSDGNITVYTKGEKLEIVGVWPDDISDSDDVYVDVMDLAANYL